MSSKVVSVLFKLTEDEQLLSYFYNNDTLQKILQDLKRT